MSLYMAARKQRRVRLELRALWRAGRLKLAAEDAERLARKQQQTGGQ
jgi:hypothetical protein